MKPPTAKDFVYAHQTRTHTIKLPAQINRAFPAPGSNRDLPASDYVLTLVEMMIDGAVCLEDVRLIIKRERHTEQTDLFEGTYRYWIIATSFSEQEKSTQAVIDFHQGRGEMERLGANGLYFTIGLLAFTLVQLLMQHYFGAEWKRKSIRSLRYYWLHLPSRIVSYARYTIARVATSLATFEQLLAIYLKLLLAPAI